MNPSFADKAIQRIFAAALPLISGVDVIWPAVPTIEKVGQLALKDDCTLSGSEISFR